MTRALFIATSAVMITADIRAAGRARPRVACARLAMLSEHGAQVFPELYSCDGLGVVMCSWQPCKSITLRARRQSSPERWLERPLSTCSAFCAVAR
ncbi:hypothetical protein K523DRAFT_43303 [Schizophyllum commune Tattone D]|nr:hypothetical protein K523DRAFT_43303 [Schizophyllum commune Tattone D]